jgi:uncharacterized protein
LTLAWGAGTNARPMGLQSLIRFILPREDQFFGFLERQADIAHQAAVALAEFRTEGVRAEDVRNRVQVLEHAGDVLLRELEEALGKTFVTPIDREDIQRLSNELDTVSDLANAAVRACVLLGVHRPTPAMAKLMEKLVECTDVLKTGLPFLARHEYGKLMEVGRSLRAKEKEGDVIYRESISALFHDVTLDFRALLREREVLDNLESAIDHCEHVGHSLVNLSVKHG